MIPTPSKAGDWESFIDHFDKEIRAGRGINAVLQTKELDLRKVPRKHVARIANIMWRCGTAELGVRLLHPIVRPSERKARSTNPTPREKAEYATSLIKIGVVLEGLRILQEPDTQEYVNTPLYRSFGHANRWEYSTVVKLLEDYLAANDLTTYEALVTKVNLAAALVHERHFLKATATLNEIIKEAKAHNYRLLLGNASHLKAANLVLQGDHEAALDYLHQAQNSIAGSITLDALFVRKWQAISSLLKTKSDSAIYMLDQVRKEARKRSHWETLRDCDRYQAVALQDEKLYLRLLFGTPLVAFREKLNQDYGSVPEPPLFYSWHPTNPKAAQECDPFGLSSPVPNSLKPGTVLCRLLATLCGDFYRPRRIPAIFSTVYNDEYYNPDTSPQRMYEIIRRLRSTLKKEKIKCDISESSGTYFVEAPGAVKIPQREWLEYPELIPLLKVRSEFSEPFSAAEMAKKLSLNQSANFRLLREASDKGLLEKSGKGKQTRYEFRKLGSPPRR